MVALFMVPSSSSIDFEADVVYPSDDGEPRGGMTRRENTTLRGTDFELWEVETDLEHYQALASKYVLLRTVQA